MKNPNKLKKLQSYRLHECGAMGEYLDEMAQKGWGLKELEGSSFYFEKIEPQELHYAVEIFAKGSLLDTSVPAAGREYIAFCCAAGWEFVCMAGQRYIFVSNQKDSVPIETDEGVNLHTAIKSTLKQNAMQWFALQLLWFLQFLGTFTNTDFFSDSNFMLVFDFMILLFLTVNGIQAVQFAVWALRQTHRLKKKKSIQYITRKRHVTNFVLCMFPLSGVLVAAVMITVQAFLDGNWQLGSILSGCIALVLLSIFAGRQIKINRAKRKRKVVILMVALMGFGCAVFLTSFSFWMVSLLGEEPSQIVYPITSYSKTIVADEARCDYIFQDGGGAFFTVFRSKHHFVIQQYLFAATHRFSSEEYKKIALPEWEADAVYYSDFFIYIIYDDYVLSFANYDDYFLKENKKFTSEQIEELKNFAHSFDIADFRLEHESLGLV